MVEEDLGLSGGHVLAGDGGSYCACVAQILEELGVRFGCRTLTLGRAEVLSLLANLVLRLVSILGEVTPAYFWWLWKVVHYVSTGGGFSAGQF